MTRSAPAGVVLTGGASTRMGVDKATLVVDGVRMVDRSVQVLLAGGVGQLVIAGPDPGGLDASVVIAPDPPGPRQGPMAGVVQAWSALAGAGDRPDPVVVMSVDLVEPSAQVIASLIAAAAESCWGAVAHDGTHLQPLLGAFRPALMDRVAADFATGERSLRQVLGRVDVEVVPIETRSQVADADRPTDLVGRRVRWSSGELDPSH